jgi:hypothetical protein
MSNWIRTMDFGGCPRVRFCSRHAKASRTPIIGYPFDQSCGVGGCSRVSGVAMLLLWCQDVPHASQPGVKQEENALRWSSRIAPQVHVRRPSRIAAHRPASPAEGDFELLGHPDGTRRRARDAGTRICIFAIPHDFPTEATSSSITSRQTTD